MFGDASPAMGPRRFSSTGAPPSPPHSLQDDPLDDIYGSAPASPASSAHDRLRAEQLGSHEILSDLPSRQRALDTDAYREGLANSKGQYVQVGFDEGYSLGANLGQRVGYILGVLQGLVHALGGPGDSRAAAAADLLGRAQKELAIQELLGKNWVDEEGIWTWAVKGAEDDVTFREVAEQHPAVRTWLDKVDGIAQEWGLDFQVLEDNNAEELETNKRS